MLLPNKDLQRYRVYIASIFLLLITTVVYLPVRHYGFFAIDDNTYVYENNNVNTGLSWDNICWAFTAGRASNWHPLTWLSQMLDVQVFGLHPGAFHVVNLFFHLANTLLLFLILQRMTAAFWPSLFVAGLFALHPLHVESVVWIAERKDVLSTFFMMLTLWCYLAYVRRPGWGRYLLIILFFALGLMAKPMLVTLPFLLLLCDYWPLSRFSQVRPAATALNNPKTQAGRKLSLGRLLVEKIPLFALAAASGIVTFLVQRAGGAIQSSQAIGFSIRLASAAESYWRYIGHMLWPTRLSVFYPHLGAGPAWRVALAVAGLLAVTAVCIWQARRRAYLLIGWLWYLGTLLPVIGLIQVGGQLIANRYTYIPLIGPFMAITWLSYDLLGRGKAGRVVLGTAAAVILVGLVHCTRFEVGLWASETALFRRALQVTYWNHLAHHMLGLALVKEGKVEEGIEQYRKALQIRPDEFLTHLAMAMALSRVGQTDEAIKHYQNALEIKPDSWAVYNNLGDIFNKQGQSEQALHYFEEAVRLNPASTVVHTNLAHLLSKQGRYEEALTHYQQILLINPRDFDATNGMAVALYRLQKYPPAIQYFRRAVELNPQAAGARSNLAAALAQLGYFDEAIKQLQEALRLEPGSATVQKNLKAILEQKALSVNKPKESQKENHP